METEIVEQVVISIEAWKEFDKVGEEVRAMEDTIREKVENNIDPVMEALLALIETHPNDYDLGRILRSIYIPLKLIIDDSENS